MEKNNLFIGLGGAGKSTFSKIMLKTAEELQEPKFVIIESSDIKNIKLDSENKHMEDTTNE